MAVIHTEDFAEWFGGLDKKSAAEVARVIEMLKARGLELGNPHSSAIAGAEAFALRELRPRQGASPLRVFYAYDPIRQAVLLIGGSKAGDNKFYKKMTRRALAIWQEYLLTVHKEKKQ